MTVVVFEFFDFYLFRIFFEPSGSVEISDLLLVGNFVRGREDIPNLFQTLHQIKLGAADRAAISLAEPLLQALIVIGMAARKQRNTWG